MAGGGGVPGGRWPGGPSSGRWPGGGGGTRLRWWEESGRWEQEGTPGGRWLGDWQSGAGGGDTGGKWLGRDVSVSPPPPPPGRVFQRDWVVSVGCGVEDRLTDEKVMLD